MKKILLTGGGTAGHIFPALAVYERLKQNGKYEFSYIGTGGMEKDIVSKEKDIDFFQINAVKLQRKLTFKNLLIPFKLLSSIRQAKKIIKKVKPDIVFSKGGFVSLPVVIASKKLKVPVISHESDLSMGLANKMILKYCDRMCVAFEKTTSVSPKCVFTGQPVRDDVLKGNKNNIDCKNFSQSKKNLLVIGGSLGAKFINDLIIDNLEILTHYYNIFHIVGKNNDDKKSYPCYKAVKFVSNIGDVYDWADIVISRAGSGCINELLTLKKLMLLIPLSKKCSRGDQIENAKLFCENGYALMLEEEEVTKEKLIENLSNLIKNDKIFIKNMKKSVNFDARDKIIEQMKKFSK